jgi:CDP-glucose 4,6-dehydratase
VATVGQVAQEVVSAWGGGEIIHKLDPDNPPESNVLRLDSSKAALKMGWRPRLTLWEAIGRAVEWYRLWLSNSSASDLIHLTRRQIEDYFQKQGSDPN